MSRRTKNKKRRIGPKKVIAVFMAFILIVSVMPTAMLSVSAADSISDSAGAKSGKTGDCTWTLDDNGVLTISGNGAMGDYDYDYFYEAPWGMGITSVVINNGVTNIGEDAFFFCARLTNVSIPNSVTSIGDSAFSNCTVLTNITIPNSVTSIDKYAFCRCTGLTNITIPDSVTSMGSHAFINCTGLTGITISNSISTIKPKLSPKQVI